MMTLRVTASMIIMLLLVEVLLLCSCCCSAVETSISPEYQEPQQQQQPKAQQQAEDAADAVRTFRTWAASKLGELNGWAMDPTDPAQLRAFLFGGRAYDRKAGERTPRVRRFEVASTDLCPEAVEGYYQLKQQLKRRAETIQAYKKQRQEKASGQTATAASSSSTSDQRDHQVREQNNTCVEEEKEPLPEYINITIIGQMVLPDTYTEQGEPSLSCSHMKALAGDPYGRPLVRGLEFMNLGIEGSKAVLELCPILQVEEAE